MKIIDPNSPPFWYHTTFTNTQCIYAVYFPIHLPSTFHIPNYLSDRVRNVRNVVLQTQLRDVGEPRGDSKAEWYVRNIPMTDPMLGCARKLGSLVCKWVITPRNTPFISRWNNPFTNHLLTSWNIQVGRTVYLPIHLSFFTIYKSCFFGRYSTPMNPIRIFIHVLLSMENRSVSTVDFVW